MRRLQQATMLNRSMHCSRLFVAPFSEQDILDLNDAFLTNGIHDITVPSIHAGRGLISTFLSSLNYYSNVACLTAHDVPHDPTIFDIYSEVAGSSLEEFFVENFYFDFMWIEALPELTSTVWFTDFEQRLLSFNIDHILPIIVLSYGNISTQ